MKGFLFPILTLFAATVLLGCSQDDSADGGGMAYSDKPVYFLAATNDASATRGSVIAAGDLPTSLSFRVYATQQRRQGDTPVDDDITEFINPGASSTDNVVTYQQVDVHAGTTYAPYYVGVWKTNVEYLWPQDTRYVNFYAVHPAEAPAINNILASKSIDYDGSTEALSLKGQYDLMYAAVRTRRDDGTFTQQLDLLPDNRAVALKFRHLLSRISFYGRLSEELASYGWKVQIQDISICNVNVAGTLTFADNPANGATFAPASPAVPKSVPMAMNDESHLTLTTTSVELDGEGNKVPLTSPTDIAMLMPQTLAAWNSNTEKSGTTQPATSGGYLAISMRILDSENQYRMGSASSYEKVFVPFAIDWKASKNYGYTLTFGLGLNAAGISRKQPITITCAITPWESRSIEGKAVH